VITLRHIGHIAVVTITPLILILGASLSSAFQPTGVGSTGTSTTHYPHKHATAHCTYKGTVASVDATAKSFVVHPAKGEDVTLKVNDQTKYSPKGKSWDDVRADAKVSCTCHKDGADTWAIRVHFAAEKAKAERAPATAKTGRK